MYCPLIAKLLDILHLNNASEHLLSKIFICGLVHLYKYLEFVVEFL